MASHRPEQSEDSRATVRFGVDRFLAAPDTFLAPFGRLHSPGVKPRIGFLTHDGARAGSGPSRLALFNAGIPLVRLFSPEHGLFATAPDGVSVPDASDPETGLPVTSLYGPALRPEARVLQDLDLVLVDIQDVGARFYTYLWSVTHLMEACAETGTPLMILDRPNPLGGEGAWVEGPLPDPGSPATFLGRWPIPVRHSLTLGEMVRLVRAEMDLSLDLRVVPLEGWRRDMTWPAMAVPFHPPSPGIPSFESALLYPGLALLEATNLHEGRGTRLAFQWFGARWMDGEKTSEIISQLGLPGLRSKSLLLPLPGHDSPCPGVSLEVTEPEVVRPVALGLRLLTVLLTLWPDQFTWAPYPTAVNPSGKDHLFRLLGTAEAVDALERIPGTIGEAEIKGWTEAPGWWDRVAPHLLYE